MSDDLRHIQQRIADLQAQFRAEMAAYRQSLDAIDGDVAQMQQRLAAYRPAPSMQDRL